MTSTEKNDAGYRKLRVWEVADRLAHDVYDVTRAFPSHEQFGLSSQLRRAALSIPTNIVEGYARKSRREFKQFASIALGSLAEVEYLLNFALSEEYLTQTQYQQVDAIRQEAGRLLWAFHASL